MEKYKYLESVVNDYLTNARKVDEGEKAGGNVHINGARVHLDNALLNTPTIRWQS